MLRSHPSLGDSRQHISSLSIHQSGQIAHSPIGLKKFSHLTVNTHFLLKYPAVQQRGGSPTAMAIPGEKAIQMVRNAHTQAAQLDIAVTAAVVDQSGRMIALGRMDKARPITVEIALNKAYTAASFQQQTKDLASVASQPWFQSLVVSSSGKVMPGGGAIPVVEGGNVVGAIAVSGGTDDQDQKCAEVALAAYQG